MTRKRNYSFVGVIVGLVMTTGIAYAASLAIKCPTIIAGIASKTYAASKGKYVCFKSAADAKKSGYKDEKTIPKKWKAVTTFSGSVSQATDTFKVSASQWKMTWQHAGDDYFSIVVYDATKNEYKKLIVSAIGVTNAKSNYYGSGTFYLDITSSSDWTIAVEQYQ
jgi:hypothetical protein